jgi:hypothetical protein
MTLRHALGIVTTGIVAIAGITWVGSGGLGVKGTTVEYVFKQDGKRMAVLRDDFVGWGHNRYVQGIADESFQPEKDERFLYINPSVLSSVRTYKFSGTTDNGEVIHADQDGLQIAFKKQ